jgi:protein-S-isoprenylcysteine O-methyltransferase Ste14
MPDARIALLLERGILAWIALAVVVAVVLLKVTAPYGRHAPARGPKVPAWLGWLLMEAPSPVGMAILFALGDRCDPVALAAIAAWELHYVNRTLIWPLRRRSVGNPMPGYVVALAFGFNLVNAGTNGLWLFRYGPVAPVDARFWSGLAVFLAGLATNVQADEVLLRLRAPGERGYRIPHGGLYRWISCPNYLGEIMEWWGFALFTGSLSGVAFAVWTTANLLPRALSHHAWYRRTFPDYPADRRALIPGIL